MKYLRQINSIINSKKKHMGIPEKIVKIELSELGRGENSRSILAIINKKYKFVFRIILKNVFEQHSSFEMMNKIHADIGPRFILFDDTRKHMQFPYAIFTYVEGKSKKKWSKKDLMLHAKSLALLHRDSEFPISRAHRRSAIDPEKKLRHDLKLFKGSSENPSVKMLLPKIIRFIRDNKNYFPQKKMNIIHGDACSINIMFHSNSARYIDWENCAFGDNAEDMARIFILGHGVEPWFIGLSESRLESFIKEYMKYYPDINLYPRVIVWNITKLFTSLLYFIWRINNFDKNKVMYPKHMYEQAIISITVFLKKRLDTKI